MSGGVAAAAFLAALGAGLLAPTPPWAGAALGAVALAAAAAMAWLAWRAARRNAAWGSARLDAERFRILVEQSPLAVAVIDRHGRYRYANRKFVQTFGYTLADVPTGRAWFARAYPDEEDRRRAIETWLGDLKESHPGESRPRVFTVTCKDGSQKVICFRPVTVAGGDQFVTYEDLTERRRLEDELHQAHKLEAIGQLAGGVAHEFNNLLTAIIGYCEVLLARLEPQAPCRQDIGQIREAGVRAAELTRQLLAFGRRQVLQPALLDANQVVADMERMLRRVIGEDIELATELWPRPCTVRADRSQLEQVVLNLALNARDAMPGGGRLGLHTAELEAPPLPARDELPDGPCVMLAVADTGVGMDARTRASAFEPFFSTKEPGRGTGLGLSTVYGIVKQSGGHIALDSEPGRGSVFRVYLPRAEQPVVGEGSAVPRRSRPA
ncbi:MAG: two-component system sensor histidine kinase NtrB [Candidatus Brocadiia bacterium]